MEFESLELAPPPQERQSAEPMVVTAPVAYQTHPISSAASWGAVDLETSQLGLRRAPKHQIHVSKRSEQSWVLEDVGVAHLNSQQRSRVRSSTQANRQQASQSLWCLNHPYWNQVQEVRYLGTLGATSVGPLGSSTSSTELSLPGTHLEPQLPPSQPTRQPPNNIGLP